MPLSTGQGMEASDKDREEITSQIDMASIIRLKIVDSPSLDLEIIAMTKDDETADIDPEITVKANLVTVKVLGSIFRT